MHKPNLNVIIFDDDQQPLPTQDIQKYTTYNKSLKPSTSTGHNSDKNLHKSTQNNQLSLFSHQIAELQTKINSLQKEGEKLKLQVQKRHGINLSNIASVNSCPKNLKQIEQVLMIVQKKIQLIIQESKKLITKMTETVDKKINFLQKEQKNQKIKAEPSCEKNKSKLNQIQVTLKQKVMEYEKHYRNQYEKFVRQTQRKQAQMVRKLSEIELKFSNKLNALETKEKEYVDWIHHLQAKLKQKKNKKMITITQQKPQLSSVPNKAAVNSGENNHTQNNLENIPNPNVQTSKHNCSIDQNNSRITRKHKIFAGKQTSPAPKANVKVSPTKDSLIPQQGPNRVANQSDLYQGNFKGENLNFYSELRKQEDQKMRQNSQRQISQNGGWDKFAQFNEFSEEYTISESDDFFAPIEVRQENDNYDRILTSIPLDSRRGTYHRQAVAVQSYESHSQNIEQKVFSPFDLN